LTLSNRKLDNMNYRVIAFFPLEEPERKSQVPMRIGTGKLQVSYNIYSGKDAGERDVAQDGCTAESTSLIK